MKDITRKLLSLLLISLLVLSGCGGTPGEDAAGYSGSITELPFRLSFGYELEEARKLLIEYSYEERDEQIAVNLIMTEGLDSSVYEEIVLRFYRYDSSLFQALGAKESLPEEVYILGMVSYVLSSEQENIDAVSNAFAEVYDGEALGLIEYQTEAEAF